jgi:S-adenosylmethionine hydrolase
MSVITLLSDFGVSDTYVAQMKGVIATLALDARVIDLTHAVPPQDVLAGALLLDDAVDAFPDRSIHVAVVDPGVGTKRQAVAIDVGRFVLVGPDNGLFTAVLQRYEAQAIVNLTSGAHQAKSVSDTFHGRDIFAPAAAYIAQGTPLHDLGEPVDGVMRLDISKPEVGAERITAHVLFADHFGNLITDLQRNVFDVWLGALSLNKVTVTIGPTTITQIRRTYGDVEAGQPVAYFGSSGRMEIAVARGSASERFNSSELSIDLR